ncbi:hypothetical protein SDJN03_09486, partial [Cucurbita argyrosperma subsp. sororia]
MFCLFLFPLATTERELKGVRRTGPAGCQPPAESASGRDCSLVGLSLSARLVSSHLRRWIHQPNQPTSHPIKSTALMASDSHWKSGPFWGSVMWQAQAYACILCFPTSLHPLSQSLLYSSVALGALVFSVQLSDSDQRSSSKN